MISRDWVKTLYIMLILPDETALIREIFIAGFILWLVNIHRYTRILPMLSAPSGTGRNCHSLSDYRMIAKPFHATRPFIRIEILRQERQVFSSNLTISNYNFEFVPRAFFHCWRCWKIRRRQAYWKKKAAENAPMINSAKWYWLILSRCSSFYVFLKRFTITSPSVICSESTLWCSETTLQQNYRNDSQYSAFSDVAKRPERLAQRTFRNH